MTDALTLQCLITDALDAGKDVSFSETESKAILSDRFHGRAVTIKKDRYGTRGEYVAWVHLGGIPKHASFRTYHNVMFRQLKNTHTRTP